MAVQGVGWTIISWNRFLWHDQLSISGDTPWFQFTLIFKTSPLVDICLGRSSLWYGIWRNSIFLWWGGFYRLVCVFTPEVVLYHPPMQILLSYSPTERQGEIWTQVVLTIRLLIHYPVYPSWETLFSPHCGWQITWHLHRPYPQKLDFYCRQTLRRSSDESQQRWWWGWLWLS